MWLLFSQFLIYSRWTKNTNRRSLTSARSLSSNNHRNTRNNCFYNLIGLVAASPLFAVGFAYYYIPLNRHQATALPLDNFLNDFACFFYSLRFRGRRFAKNVSRNKENVEKCIICLFLKNHEKTKRLLKSEKARLKCIFKGNEKNDHKMWRMVNQNRKTRKSLWYFWRDIAYLPTKYLFLKSVSTQNFLFSEENRLIESALKMVIYFWEIDSLFLWFWSAISFQ